QDGDDRDAARAIVRQHSRFDARNCRIARLSPEPSSQNQAASQRRSFMYTSWCRTACGVALLAAPLVAARGQQVSYNRAEQLLDWNTSLITFGDEVRPQWLLDGARFWYRNKTQSGAEFVLVDPVRNT